MLHLVPSLGEDQMAFFPMSKLNLLLLLLISTGSESSKKRALSFGGNGFIGSTVLLSLMDTYEITLVSRGSWPFDSLALIKPHISRLVICDRAKEATCLVEAVANETAAGDDCDINSLRLCPELSELVREADDFDLVIDFSAFDAKWVHDAIDLLAKADTKVGLYLYISSDSVYDVSQKMADINEKSDAEEAADLRNVFTTEDEAVRPRTIRVREELNHKDRYGNNKLSGEEALKEQQQEPNGFPWVALRLSDVFGARDSTYRYYVYLLKVLFGRQLGLPMQLPAVVADVKESLTFVDDVAKAVLAVLEKGKAVHNQSYNIALDQGLTLGEVFEAMAMSINHKLVREEDLIVAQDDAANKGEAFYLYPTVLSGPMDVSKAKKILGWTPTPVEEAFGKTTRWWLEEAMVNMESEREEALNRVISYLLPKELKENFLLAVDKWLEARGVVTQRYRKKRKGDIDEQKDEL